MLEADCSRSLFVLHENIIQLQRRSADCNSNNFHSDTRSLSALESASRMMAAVAKSHMEDVDNIDVLPLTASYNVRVALKYLRLQPRSPDESFNVDIDALQRMEAAFQTRWRWVTD
jgi:hypothetical protein